MKQPYGYWSPQTFKRKLALHGLTPEEAAELVGAKRRAGYYWVEHGPPLPICLIYELMELCGLSPEELEEIKEQLTVERN